MIDVKVGDEVVVSEHHEDRQILRVSRVLKRTIETDNGQSWGTQTGVLHGFRNYSGVIRIRAATPDEIAAVRREFARKNLARRIAATDFSKLDMAQLRGIEALIGESK